MTEVTAEERKMFLREMLLALASGLIAKIPAADLVASGGLPEYCMRTAESLLDLWVDSVAVIEEENES